MVVTPRRKQKVKYSRKIACKHLNSQGDISNSLQPLAYCPTRDLMLGTKAYVCQVCSLYIPVKSNSTIDDVFIESKKAAEIKIKEKAEQIKMDELIVEDSIDLSIDEFEEDDDNLPEKFEKRKAGKSNTDDDDEFQNICPFCDEIFDDLTSHIPDCEFAPEDASINDVLPRSRKKKRRKKPGATTTTTKTDDNAVDKEKQKCPYCGKDFQRLGRHLNSCKKKPKDAEADDNSEED